MNNSSFHILVVDDDDRIRELVKQYLEENNFLVTTAIDAFDAKKKLDIIKYDILILDIMMPGKSGLSLTEEIKKTNSTPVILLTAKGGALDRIKGLEIGADDYLGKPFEPKELLLRIQNILNKTKKPVLPDEIYVGNFIINLKKLHIKTDKKTIKINPQEKKVLEKMLEVPGKIFSRNDIGKIINISKERTIDDKKLKLIPKIQNIYKQLGGLVMLYGLNNFIKKILPKRLFYRSLLIVAAPIILLQIIITVVFFDSLWIKANKGMTRSLVSEIRTLYDVYKSPDMAQRQGIINLYFLKEYQKDGIVQWIEV